MTTDDAEWHVDLAKALDELRAMGDNDEDPSWQHILLRSDLEENGFWEYLRTQDMIGLILRVHLWVEQALGDVLTFVLPEPEHLPDQMSLTARLNLALALGFDFGEMVAVLKRLNKMRNAASHAVGWQPDESEQRHLISLLPDDTPLPPFAESTSAKFASALMLVAFWASSAKLSARRIKPIRLQQISVEQAEEFADASLRGLIKAMSDGANIGRLDLELDEFERLADEVLEDMIGRYVEGHENLNELGVDYEEFVRRMHLKASGVGPSE